MRVAIFTDTYFPFVSGVVTHVHSLREGLEQAGHEVLIVTPDPKARRHYIKDHVLYCPAVALKRIYGYGISNPVNLHRLAILREFDPDIIHIHTEFSTGIFGLYTAKQLHRPMVYTLHTMYDEYIFYIFPERVRTDRVNKMAQPAVHAYIRKIASAATEIIGPSVKVADYLRHCGVSRHINVVPNTVDLSAFEAGNVPAAQVAAIKQNLDIKPDDIALIFVGRLGKEKSIDVLIDHFSQCFLGQARFKLFIIGDGPQREELKGQIAALGAQNQVFLLGRVEHGQIPAYYQACDLFATASLTEMNSISLLEATASGLYAVTRLDVYNRDQIHQGKNGEVFTTPDEFGAIVRRYAELDDTAKASLRASVSAYARRYGLPEFTEAILAVYTRARDKYYHVIR